MIPLISRDEGWVVNRHGSSVAGMISTMSVLYICLRYHQSKRCSSLCYGIRIKGLTMQNDAFLVLIATEIS